MRQAAAGDMHGFSKWQAPSYIVSCCADAACDVLTERAMDQDQQSDNAESCLQPLRLLQ